MIHDVAPSADKRAGMLPGIDDQVDLANSHGSCRRANYAERLAGRAERHVAGPRALSVAAAGCAQPADVPFGSAERSVAVKVDVDEGPRVGGVDLYQCAIGRLHISELGA